jgi:hypothetical protein
MESRRLQGGVDSAVRPGLVSESEIVADEEKENDSINSQTDSDQDEYIAIIREAFLVEEDTDAEIIEAALVEPSPPWWKMRRAEQMFFFVILLRCQYLLALIAHPTITEINFAEQRSEQIELVASQAYYFEVSVHVCYHSCLDDA